MTVDFYEYRIASHYLSALINADASGLDDSDEKALQDFEVHAKDNARANFGGQLRGMHWDCDSDDNGEDYGPCDVSGLFAGRATVRLVCMLKD